MLFSYGFDSEFSGLCVLLLSQLEGVEAEAIEYELLHIWIFAEDALGTAGLALGTHGLTGDDCAFLVNLQSVNALHDLKAQGVIGSWNEGGSFIHQRPRKDA